VTLRVSEPKLGNEAPGALGGGNDVGFDIVEEQFGAPEHGESRIRIDGAPGQVDEPLPGSAWM
jgi:hypothetical protein